LKKVDRMYFRFNQRIDNSIGRRQHLSTLSFVRCIVLASCSRLQTCLSSSISREVLTRSAKRLEPKHLPPAFRYHATSWRNQHHPSLERFYSTGGLHYTTAASYSHQSQHESTIPVTAMTAESSEQSPTAVSSIPFEADRVTRAIQMEESYGLKNVRGRQYQFAQFMSGSFSNLAENLPKDTLKWRGASTLSTAYLRYGPMTSYDRQALLAHTRDFLSSCDLSAPTPRSSVILPVSVTRRPVTRRVPWWRGQWLNENSTQPLVSNNDSIRNDGEQLQQQQRRQSLILPGRTDTSPIKPRSLPLVIESTDEALVAGASDHDPSSRGGGQGSQAWHGLRANRLTASSFGAALGFFDDRQRLWEEKVGLRERFAGNDATMWGQESEPKAALAYKEITGHDIRHVAFAVYRADEAEYNWLGASPDGLIGESGTLEIKCPWNKGQPVKAQPHTSVPWYYMCQVQGVMEILDREWCDVFSWTVSSSSLFRVPRDPVFWNTLLEALQEFWWEHVVPAREAFEQDDMGLVEKYRPAKEHKLSQHLIQYCRRLSSDAQRT